MYKRRNVKIFKMNNNGSAATRVKSDTTTVILTEMPEQPCTKGGDGYLLYNPEDDTYLRFNGDKEIFEWDESSVTFIADKNGGWKTGIRKRLNSAFSGMESELQLVYCQVWWDEEQGGDRCVHVYPEINFNDSFPFQQLVRGY
jgi:hypothetical protein